jgi:phage replication-related protein YjqB (UPF0714/DUF867 family)
MKARLAKDFRKFADLAAAYEEDKDFRIVQVARLESATAVVAPHGGSIEAHTSYIARAIAGQDFSLYLFEGRLRSGNFAALHLSSHLFDEPGCLKLIAACDRVITVHGCGHAGERVLVGGRNLSLRRAITRRLKEAGLACEDAPADLDAADSNNICNRGRTGAGVQLEITAELRVAPI